MSLKAGGVGLNLTAASSVFLMVPSLFKLCFFKSSWWWWIDHLVMFLEIRRIHGGIRRWKSKRSWEFIE